MIPIIMPQVGQDYLTGTIVEWLKSENEPVQKGEVVLRVESEKATFDVEADGDGVEGAQFLNRLKACLEDVPGDSTLWAM
jgi:hypothetical protein